MLPAKQVQAVSFDKGVQAIILVVQHDRYRNVAAACGQWHLKHRNKILTQSSPVVLLLLLVYITIGSRDYWYDQVTKLTKSGKNCFDVDVGFTA